MTTARPQLEETWIEQIGLGFPACSVGVELQTRARGFDPSTKPEIVETKNSFTLTTIQIDSTLAFAEFLAGSPFPALDLQMLTRVITSDFRTDPAAASASFDQILRALVQVPGMDPERRALQRNQSMRDIKLAEIANGVATPIMETIERYNPVLYVNADRAITGDALAAYWSLFDMFAAITGLPASSIEDQVELATTTAEAYEEWPPRVRSEIAEARSRWVGVRAILRAMTDDEFDEFATSIRREVHDADDVVAAVIGFGLSIGVTATARRVQQRMVGVS